MTTRLGMIGAGNYSRGNIDPCFHMLKDVKIAPNADLEPTPCGGLRPLQRVVARKDWKKAGDRIEDKEHIDE